VASDLDALVKPTTNLTDEDISSLASKSGAFGPFVSLALQAVKRGDGAALKDMAQSLIQGGLTDQLVKGNKEARKELFVRCPHCQNSFVTKLSTDS